MNVLFLDIDGVLNSTDWYIRRQKKDLKEVYAYHDWHYDLDPVPLGLLKKLMTDVPDLNIVISSSWRMSHTLEEFKKQLAPLISVDPERFIGMTPTHKFGRGEEIKEWLSQHPEVKQFAIIDDDSFDMGDMLPHLHKTENSRGMLSEHTAAIKEVFHGL